MRKAALFRKGILCAALVLALATPLTAQVEDHLAAYTGGNATGYLNPLVNAIGANLNAGLFYSAHIPKMGFHLSLEFPVQLLVFADDTKTFTGVTEQGITPQQTAEVSTVVGPEEATIISGDGGTSFAFPGGFNLNSFGLFTPQLRIGAVFGTEALIRYFAVKVGDIEYGDLSLFGIGVRHSISQYLGPAPPLDLAMNFFWQQFKAGKNQKGDDLSVTDSYTIGVHASRKVRDFIEPYTGLSYDAYSTEVEYTSEASGTPEATKIKFDKDTVHWTIGLRLHASILSGFIEYNIASTSNFALGLGFGF